MSTVRPTVALRPHRGHFGRFTTSPPPRQPRAPARLRGRCLAAPSLGHRRCAASPSMAAAPFSLISPSANFSQLSEP
ncbi:hypothetical protein SESBI_05883 [Sesbania bispinosa]|nr:hypothetical protein SESBI_05883 [Sesbania bispinosa]